MVVDGVVDAVVAEREAEGQSADWLFVGLDFLKATPHTEGERRFVHFEASNDALDQEGERILCEEVAARIGTINYEIACGISPRVPRRYVRSAA